MLSDCPTPRISLQTIYVEIELKQLFKKLIRLSDDLMRYVYEPISNVVWVDKSTVVIDSQV